MTTLRLDTIEFRPTTGADLDLVLQIETDSANTPYIRHWSREKHQSALADDNIAHFIVQTVEEKQIVGYVILPGVLDPDGNLEFKRIAIAEKGNGYGRLAVRLIKKFAFEQARAHRLWLEVAEHNDRAFRLYESEGFILEGVHREAMKQGEKRYSLKVMSILLSEYST